LAGCGAMSDEQIAQVRRFVASGGKLCVTGPLATHDAWMFPREKSALADLPAERVLRVETPTSLVDAVGQALNNQPSLRIHLEDEREAPLGLCVELTRGDNRHMVHLVNYRTDSPVEKVVVEMRIPTGQADPSVVLAGPGREQDLKISATREGNFVKFVVPQVDIYEVAVVSFDR